MEGNDVEHAKVHVSAILDQTAGDEERSRPGHRVPKGAVRAGQQHGFEQPRLVFEGDELHEMPAVRFQPARGGHDAGNAHLGRSCQNGVLDGETARPGGLVPQETHRVIGEKHIEIRELVSDPYERGVKRSPFSPGKPGLETVHDAGIAGA